MTFTFELGLYKFKTNRQAKCQWSWFRSYYLGLQTQGRALARPSALPHDRHKCKKKLMSKSVGSKDRTETNDQ